MLQILVKLHRACLKADTAEPQKLFVMLKLIPEAPIAQRRPPLALALVIDTSGSMREFADQQRSREEIEKRGLQQEQQLVDGETIQRVDLSLPTKLDQAIDAAHALIDHPGLTAADQLSLIQFDTGAQVLLPLCPLADRDAAHRAVDSLRNFEGATDMAEGLRLALPELSRVPSPFAKRLLLLTDGKTTAAEECLPLAEELAGSNTPIVAIGIGEEYRQELLLRLAEAGHGRHYHLQKMEELRDYLSAEVGAAVREVVTDLQAQIATVKGVTLDSLTRVYPSLSEVNAAAQPYRLGNIPSGDFTVFILELTLAGVARPYSRARIARVSLTGHLPAVEQPEALPVQDLFVTFTPDEAAVARVDQEVLGYVLQKNLSRMVGEAAQMVTVDAARARKTLQAVVRMTQQLGNASVTRSAQKALAELGQSGTVSPDTLRTLRSFSRTKTIKSGQAPGSSDEEVPPDEEIRRQTGL